MSDPKKIKRNKKIAIVFSIALNVVCVCYLLSRSSFYGFSDVLPRLNNVGLKDVAMGILSFSLFWWAFGALYASFNGMLVFFLLDALHWRDPPQPRRRMSPEFEEEAFVAFGFAMVSSLVLFGILLLIHMLGIVEINWFLS